MEDELNALVTEDEIVANDVDVTVPDKVSDPEDVVLVDAAPDEDASGLVAEVLVGLPPTDDDDEASDATLADKPEAEITLDAEPLAPDEVALLDAEDRLGVSVIVMVETGTTEVLTGLVVVAQLLFPRQLVLVEYLVTVL
jgi:hypothetical protein